MLTNFSRLHYRWPLIPGGIYQEVWNVCFKISILYHLIRQRTRINPTWTIATFSCNTKNTQLSNAKFMADRSESRTADKYGARVSHLTSRHAQAEKPIQRMHTRTGPRNHFSHIITNTATSTTTPMYTWHFVWQITSFLYFLTCGRGGNQRMLELSQTRATEENTYSGIVWSFSRTGHVLLSQRQKTIQLESWQHISLSVLNSHCIVICNRRLVLLRTVLFIRYE